MFFIEVFVILGTIAFSISGAVVGIKKEMDLFGVLTLCAVTALGGGVIRDVLIGNIPPAAFTNPHYFLISIGTGILTWFFYERLVRLENIIMVTDAIGLGVFTAVGASAALSQGAGSFFIMIAMGLVTGIGGGIIRDLFAKEIPYVFRKEVYAISSIAGAFSMIIMYPFVSLVVSMYVCLVICFLVRVITFKYNIHIPVLKPRNNGF